MEKLNEKLFLVINSLVGKKPAVDKVIVFLAKNLPYFFIAFLLYLWFKDKESKKKVIFITIVTTMAIFVNFLIGKIYFHPRPFVKKLGTALIKHKADASFPSDHATFMFTISLILINFKNTRIAGVVALVLSIFGGLFRIYCGVHFPFDILGSFIVALFISLFAVRKKEFFEKLSEKIVNKYYELV